MTSEWVLTFRSLDRDTGIEHEYGYETIEIPARKPPEALPTCKLATLEIPAPQPAPPPKEFVHETIEIPARKPPTQLPKQHYEYLEVKKGMPPPYFTWTELGPNKVAWDLIINIPVSVPPSGWFQKYCSIVITGNLIEIWGNLLWVRVYDATGAHLVGSVNMTKASYRPNIQPVPGSAAPITWDQVEDEYFIELEGGALISIRDKREIKIWDAEEVKVYETGTPHRFTSHALPRPYPFPHGLRASIQASRNGQDGS